MIERVDQVKKENTTYFLPEDKAIVLFDGVCNMCNSLVQFVIKMDKKEQFYFASLQSEAGQKLLQHAGIQRGKMDTFVYIDHKQSLIKSSAGLNVFRRLGGWWRILYAGIFAPRPIRDWIYRQIASRRYQWFGKKEQCMIPTPQQRARFIETAEDIERLCN